MILRTYLHADPVGISYFAGCSTFGLAAVIDPVEPLEPYLQTSEAAGARIRFVIDTHLHADHVSAGRRLAAATGADYVLSAKADVAFPFRAVHDAETLEAGNTRLKVLDTPGHTPEHICLLVTDLRRADDPWFVLTGHTLLVGDMGRTELATSAEAGARALFASARRLAALPDHIEVLSGAYAGSVCGRHLSGKPSSTIGFERRHNHAFRIDREEDFVRFMLTDVPPAPPRAAETRAINSGRGAAEAAA